MEAKLFSDVMNYLWGNGHEEYSFVVRAIGDKLKGTARCNFENALDVRERVFPDSECNPYLTQDATLMFDVKFLDGSRALIETMGGIGSNVEIVD